MMRCETCRLLVCAVCFDDRFLNRMLSSARSARVSQKQPSFLW